MDNFGVIEIASSRTTAAPGWAYVPDLATNPTAALQPTGRKRAAARGQGLSFSDQTAREEARVRKELEALDKEGSRDVVIPVPAKGRGKSATRS
jgi:zinc finger HIT domain-containing protein 1